MKILFANIFESYTSKSIVYYLKKMGHSVNEVTYYTPDDYYNDNRLTNMIGRDLNAQKYDCVFTVNIWPLVARTCHEKRIPYLAWSYDSPQNLPHNQDLDYDTNFLFIFDRAEVDIYHKEGIEQVYHLPLAADIDRWDRIKASGCKYDVSLIGTLYESTLPSLMAEMNEYQVGYINGILEAQKKIYGYYLVDDVITDEFIYDINRQFKNKSADADDINKRQLMYSIGSYLTYFERLTLLRILSSRANVHLFSSKINPDIRGLLKDVNIHGWASYDYGMPQAFKESKINLNPSLRIIRSGISLRCMDILGCGGFLLSSYQQELAEYFVPDAEVVLYESIEDAFEKAMFYISHDDIRNQIARGGYKKVKQEFNYPKQLQKMFDVAGVR